MSANNLSVSVVAKFKYMIRSMQSARPKIKAIKSGMQVEFAKRTNVQVEKNHIGGVQSRGRVVMTPHGFIPDDKRAIDKYKDAHKEHWLKLVGSVDFDLIEEGDLEETPISPNLLD